MGRLINMRRNSLAIMAEGLWHSSVDSYEPALYWQELQIAILLWN